MTDSPHNSSFRESLAGLWALLWHSVVLLPVALGMFGLYCCAWIGLVAFPVVSGIFLSYSDWRDGLLCMVPWPVCLVVVRWFWCRERKERGGHGWL